MAAPPVKKGSSKFEPLDLGGGPDEGEDAGEDYSSDSALADAGDLLKDALRTGDGGEIADAVCRILDLHTKPAPKLGG